MYEEYYEDEVPKTWTTPKTVSLVIFEVCAIAFFIYLKTDKDGYAGILDNFNLLIHKSGHVVFSVFGNTMHLWGGTLLQCIAPIIIIMSFWHFKQTAGLAFSGIWLGENFLFISRYILDAFPMKRTLPGCPEGIHDWNVILGNMGVLSIYKFIGGIVLALGWLIMITSAVWYSLMWYLNYEDKKVKKTKKS